MPVAAVIVLYNPVPEVWKNIQQCASQVEKVYLVDNSESPAMLHGRHSGSGRIVYFWNGGNQGIAHALNRGAELAIAEGFSYLLTLDQDSFPEDGMVDTLVGACSDIEVPLGIAAAGKLIGVDLEGAEAGKPSPVLSVWTSGNLLSLEAYRAVGPFREELFIDFVDHEFCLRLNRFGFGVYRIPGASLRHCFGDRSWRIVFFGRSFWVTNHSPTRRYYIARNRLLVRSLFGADFPAFFRKDRLFMILECLAIALFEKRKREKFHMMLRGVRDFKAGIFGKYNG